MSRRGTLSSLTLSLLAGWLVLTAALPAAGATDLTIEHEPLQCVVHGTFPRLDAEILPADPSGEARIFFRATGTEDWYFVALAADEDGRWTGALPKPSARIIGFDYYLQARGETEAEAKTDTYQPVVSTRTYCENQSMTVAEEADLDNVSLILGLLRPDQNPLPEGFAADGITAVQMPDGTLKDVSQLSAEKGMLAKTKTWLSTGNNMWYAVGGGALVVGGAAVAASSGGGGGGSSPPETMTGSWRVQAKCVSNPQVIFDINIQVSENAGGYFSGSGTGTDIDGEPLTATIEGHYDAESHELAGELRSQGPSSGVRIDLFATTLTSKDSGWVPMTCIQDCACDAEIRLKKR